MKPIRPGEGWKKASLLGLVVVVVSLLACSTPGTGSADGQNKAKAYQYLSAVSDRAVQGIKDLSYSDNVSGYINYVSSLTDKEFARYALENRLCMEDGRLAEVEKQFLADPDKYLTDVYAYELERLKEADPELADKMQQLPYLRGKPDVKMIEAMDDILGLARNPNSRQRLEHVYGKGMQSKMQRVALERLFWRATEGDFDVNSPFEGSEWYIYSHLADFQAKYSAAMDQDGVPGTKPAIRGMNLFHEPLGNTLGKSLDEQKFDYALIRWVLRCNAVRLSYGAYPTFSLNQVKLAQDEGVDVWMLFWPISQPPYTTSTDPSLLTRYKDQLAEFCKKAQENNVKGIWVGGEFDAWWKIWGGTGDVTKYDVNSAQIKSYMDELVQIARQYYSGLVSYQEWDFYYRPDRNVNWNNMDMVSLTGYVGNYNSQCRSDDVYLSTFRNIKNTHNKPLYIVELGSFTVKESEQVGAADIQIARGNVHYDPQTQAGTIDRYLRLQYQVSVDVIFIYLWDESANQAWGWGDFNKLGKGIWDYVAREPKPSFWTVYKYFKE
jgi:hypothetical protein